VSQAALSCLLAQSVRQVDSRLQAVFKSCHGLAVIATDRHGGHQVAQHSITVTVPGEGMARALPFKKVSPESCGHGLPTTMVFILS
jgi:hypothetical protein